MEKILKYSIGISLGAAVLIVAFAAGVKLKQSTSAVAPAEPMNGFDVSRHMIPLDEIMEGGPPRDGIRALTDPRFVKAGKASYLGEDDRVIGIMLDGLAKAYPIKILNWHEIVNDRIGDRPVLVTYCPLCGTGMVFDPVVDGERRLFGVSGLLYNSDVLMYDRDTGSLWSQIQQQAVTGPLMGKELPLLFSLHTAWKAWRDEHPQTLVLSDRTGYIRDYRRDPYADYAARAGLMFPVSRTDAAAAPKEWVLGVVVGEEAKAFSFAALSVRSSPFQDRIGEKAVRIHFDPVTRTAFVTDEQGSPVPSVVSYWFAWYAFYPGTEIMHPVPHDH